MIPFHSMNFKIHQIRFLLYIGGGWLNLFILYRKPMLGSNSFVAKFVLSGVAADKPCGAGMFVDLRTCFFGC